MARSEARVTVEIFSNEDFIAMDEGPQRMFMLLLAQSDLSHAGLIPLRVNRWAKLSGNTTPERINEYLDYLADRRFILVDRDTEEVLVRTMIRNDGVYKQPKVMVCARDEARQIRSKTLRRAFAIELDRIPVHVLSDKPNGPNGDRPSTRSVVQGVLDSLREDFADALATPEPGVSDTPGDGYAIPPATGTGYSHTRARAHSPIPVPRTPYPDPLTPSTSSSSETDDGDEPEPDPGPDPVIEELCEHLADRIEANGSPRPKIGKKWRDACRLMRDRDSRTPEQIRAAIDWCQDDEFWRSNVLSMPKLRQQYEQLRLQAQRGRASPPTLRLATADQRLMDAAAIKQRLLAEEANQLPEIGA